ncbi:MAG: zf-HC2 domain-containing protein [Pseudomonadota bacterium]
MTATIDHAQAFDLLPWYVNDTLDAETRAAIDVHLAECSMCTAELRLLDELQAAVIAEPAPLSVADGKPPWWVTWRRAWWVTPSRLRWVLGVETAAVAAVVVWLLLPSATPEPAAFRTLTAPAEAGAADVHVVFDAGVTEAEVRAVLLAHDLTFADGPSDAGVYLVTPADPATSADPIALAERLGNEPPVRFAAPAR